MKIGQAKGAQVGDGNTQHNTYLPPQKSGRHSARDSSPVTVTAGDNSTVNTTQKNTNLKFSIPIIGPLFTFASVHPVIAVTTAAAVLGGTGAVASGAMSSSKSGVSTQLVRGFHLTEAETGAQPIGYDFSRTPPVLAGPNTEAIYIQGGFVYSSSGKLAEWTGATNPTAAQCSDAVAKQPVREVVISVGSMTCYLDLNGNTGYFTITSSPMTGNYITIDTAHLG
ncbi:hypothetical protein Caci_6934 [Catenulispora acidiphila DSM 44928]|uniref:Uncharacterized protein n=1 Tax=Catenulispora acidiphila (strain DSM 44928 / JCM 14897 / NBRC 102108 / NRRL B-24433 / ID139908) TaxID=479433 RepID=C7Q3K2_CATAD|nr:hypothetical protein [Catenulispora acidiphila]ACU75767.1 hypothetical protein Caci_6934 [Catenulispora acidiphila DSM 44928]